MNLPSASAPLCVQDMSSIPSSFAFSAQTAAGEPLSGTIDAASISEADRRLRSMQLRVVSLNPSGAAAIEARPARRVRRLRGSDFQLFNAQLAHLSSAGLPIEQGLRLIAEDMRSGRLAEAVRAMAVELEAGGSLADVLQQHAGQFPPLYAQLVKAGIAAGNLPGVLLNLGRHLEMIAAMRASLWRALTYPAFVLLALLGVMLVLGVAVFPQFRSIFKDFHTDLPAITQIAVALSDFLVQNWRWLLAAAVILIVGWILLWALLGRLGQRQRWIETLVFPIPIVGRALKWNFLARWTDALKLGVEAGLDLPAAFALAADAVRSPALMSDGERLIAALKQGQPLDQITGMRLLPPTVLAVLSLASGRNDLPASLDTLSTMFQQQAEVRIMLIPTTLTPILIIIIALMVIFAILAMFAPMISLIQAISGPHGW